MHVPVNSSYCLSFLALPRKDQRRDPAYAHQVFIDLTHVLFAELHRDKLLVNQLQTIQKNSFDLFKSASHGRKTECVCPMGFFIIIGSSYVGEYKYE
jgi:hypothetical protein